MEKIYTINHLSELPQLARELLADYKNERIFAFCAPMGAGKTTFIKVLCETLGVTDTISSPTFSLVNEYHTTDNTKIFHFDFYRIKSVSEAYDMGYEDYFYSNAYCFIEWPERVEELLADNYVKITIRIEQDEQRIFTVEKIN